MTDQLLAELRKMRSTRTNLGLLGGMVALILLTVLLNGFIPKPHELATLRQPVRAALGRHLGRAVRRADRRDGDHERVPPRHDPTDVRRHAAPDPRRRREGDREPADGRPLRARRDRALLRRRLRDPLGPRHPARARDERHVLWLVLGTPAMTAAWAALGVGLGAVVRNQVFAVIGLIVWAMVIDNLLRGLVPSIGGYTPVGASAALVADPADYVLAAAAGGLLLLGYVAAFVPAGSLLVARRDVT